MTAQAAAPYGRGLSYLEPRRAVTLAAARRRSVFVKALRITLGVAILGISSSIATIVIRHAAIAGNSPAEGGAETRTVRMINPRFTGRDTDGVPYVITADAAMREAGGDERIELSVPALVFEDPDGPTLFVNATVGDFIEETSALDLEGDVRFASANGYEFFTSSARVYLREGRIVGEEPVSGNGPLGEIESQSFEIIDGGARILFYDNVVGRIDQEPRLAPPLREEGDDAGVAEDVDGQSAGGDEDG